MKSEISNISGICSDLASKVSPTGIWSEFKTPQDISLERSGYVGLEGIDSVSVQFEAKRIADDDVPTRFPKVSYILRLVAAKELVHEELPAMARSTIEKAEVAVSTSTLIIATEAMLEEQNEEGVECEEENDDSYRYERFIQYILDRNGSISEYTEGQGYLVNGEEMTQVSYSQSEGQSLVYRASPREDRVVGQHFTITDEGISLDETLQILPEVHPIKDMRTDLLFTDFLAEHSSEIDIAGQSVQEHRQRIMAMIGFVTLQTDANDLIQTAFA